MTATKHQAQSHFPKTGPIARAKNVTVGLANPTRTSHGKATHISLRAQPNFFKKFGHRDGQCPAQSTPRAKGAH